MITFLTHKRHGKTAEALDMMRLGKTRDTARRILEVLLGEDDGRVTANPAIEMWRGYEGGLVYYGMTIAYQWSVVRKFEDHTLKWFARTAQNYGLDQTERPPWLEDVWLLRSHRSNLVAKMAHHYADQFPATPERMPYLWPVNRPDGSYELRVSMADMERIAAGERALPDGVTLVDPATGLVAVG